MFICLDVGPGTAFSATMRLPLASSPVAQRAFTAVRGVASGSPALAYLGCSVYVSEGHDERLLGQLKDAASSSPDAHLVNTFVDKPYNRSSFTLISHVPDSLADVAVRIASLALECLDLRKHAATHPRLGVADHISCHPISDAASLQDAAAVAKSIAGQLSHGPHQLPVYLYGSASQHGKRLADIRRQLGYFHHNGSSTWSGALGYLDLQHFPPDMGPARAQLQHGVMTVGAVPWIVNYNVPLETHDLAAARTIARAISERCGGLPSVEAMALQHNGAVEVACNLLDFRTSGPQQVQQAVQAAADHHGIAAGQGYCIGKLPEEMVALASRGQ